MRVLVAEDEPDMAGLIARGLADEEYSVDIATDGDQALSMRPAAITIWSSSICDCHSKTASPSARTAGPSLPSSDSHADCSGTASDIIAGLNCGADDYLVNRYRWFCTRFSFRDMPL